MESQKELLEEWKANRPEYKRFVMDGILDEISYTESTPNILFLLKESNDDFEQIAPIKKGSDGYGPSGNSNTFWRLISGWYYIAYKAWNEEEITKYDAMIAKEKPVISIAYINIKKKIENKSISDDSEIFEFARNDCDFIKRQIDLTAPQITFCGETNKSFDFFYNSERIDTWIFLSDKRLVIDYHHPSCRHGYKTFDTLISNFSSEMVKEVIKRIKS